MSSESPNPFEVARKKHPSEYPLYTTMSYPLWEVLEKTHPKVPETIRNAAYSILVGLTDFTINDKDESSMYLRGGTMRNWMIPSQQMTTELAKDIWRKTHDVTSDDERLAKDILEHGFGLTDVDVILNLKDVIVTDEGIQRPSHEEMLQNIQTSLASGRYGVPIVGRTEIGLPMQLGEYTINIKIGKIGRTQKRPKYDITFYKDNQAVYTLSIFDRPRSDIEIKENVRFFPENPTHTDSLSIGYIHRFSPSNPSSPLMLTTEYARWGLMSLAQYEHEVGLLDSQEKLSGDFLGEHLGDATRATMKAVRGISTKISDVGSWILSLGFVSYPDLLDALKTDIDQDRNRAGIKKLHSISARLSWNHDSYLKRMVMFLSDYLYCLTINPLLSIPMTYYDGLLDVVNLGEIINKEDRMRFVVQYITEAISDIPFSHQKLFGLISGYSASCVVGPGHSSGSMRGSDPLVVLDALSHIQFSDEEKGELQKKGLYPPDVPRTVTGLLRYLVPFGLDWKECLAV